MAARYRDKVERICHRFFSDRELIRDLTQESFIRAFSGLKSYRSELPFVGWLRAIVVNLCYDELRRRRRRPEELIADFSASEVSWIDLVSYATPEEIISSAQERHESRSLAHRLLATLKPEDRTVLVLRDAEEMSVADIAALMHWSEAKVKIRAFRARQALRRVGARLLLHRRGGEIVK